MQMIHFTKWVRLHEACYIMMAAHLYQVQTLPHSLHTTPLSRGFDHDEQISRTKGAGRCSLITERGHWCLGPCEEGDEHDVS